MKKRLVVFLTLICIAALLVPFTVSAAEAGTVTEGLGYYEDGTQVTDDVILYEGAYYAFDESGAMLVNQAAWIKDGWYRAREDGTLYVNEWYYHEDWDSWYYYGEEGKAAQDFLMVNGVWYFFDGDGHMRQDEVVWSNDYQAYYILSQDGEQHTKVVQGWQQAYGNWYYSEKVDGEIRPITNDTRNINGKWYGFEWSGKMAEDEQIWVDGGMCRANADGVLYVNAWYFHPDREVWYYYGAEGIAPQDFCKIGGVWYYFDYDGEMFQDRVVWSSDYQAYYVLSQDGSEHKAFYQIGWNQLFGNWYYVVEEEGSQRYRSGELFEDNGKQYYFDWDGKMLADHCTWISELGKYMYADANGVLTDTAWFKDAGYWRYLQNGQFLENGIYQIGNKLYSFDWNGYLNTEPGEYEYYGEYYYIAPGGEGKLYRNQWRYCEILYPSEIGWVFYGNDGRMVRNQVLQDGSKLYGFDYNGVMVTNTIREFDGVTYSFDAAGVATALADGWRKHPVTQEWMYVHNGMLPDGILQIGNTAYGFSEGYMLSNTWWWEEYNGTYGYYLFGANGAMITTKGWVKADGDWYFVQEDGTLKEGWLSDGGKWYYMEPAMAHDKIVYAYDEEKCYVANSKGVCVAVQGSGLQSVTYDYYDRDIVYLQNGKAVTNTWKRVDGYWYYFDEGGCAYRNGTYSVGNELYLFDSYGKMCTGGWVSMWGDWYYADPTNDSALLTGLQTFGNTRYLFDGDGAMVASRNYYYNGTYYLTASNGVVLMDSAKEGWNQVGNDWYYVQGGYIVANDVFEINGAYYGFDDDGRMFSDCYAYCNYRHYLFAANGKALTGWQKVDGQWIYADPEYCYAYTWDYEIGDKYYVFDNDGYLMYGSFVRYGTRYTTDSDGAVVKQAAIPDGWFLSDGTWYYTVDGEGYNGWLGDYYLYNGRMAYNEFVEYNGKYYYLTHTGLCLRNGWYETLGEGWIYARADGSLVCSQWLQSGSTWYYFYGYRMLADTVEWIDGELHSFNEDGKWLGVVTYEPEYRTGLSDGWHKIGGSWYYYYNGMPSFGDMLIDGKRYYFDQDTGIMVTNTMEGDNGWYFYGSDGAAVNYTGWVKLKGEWHYFNPDHTLYFGFIRDSKGLCNLYWAYNVDTEEYECVMRRSEYCKIGGELYYFDASGYTKGAISANGWYHADEDWYYFENGALIGSGVRKIGNATYYFYEGRMSADTVEYVNGVYRYFDASGKMVTKAGWYKVDGEIWVYVRDTSGRLYEDGIYIIGGKEYTFWGCRLVE